MKSRAWASVYRIPVQRGLVYFKACAPVQGFEPWLSRALYGRWPDRVGVVMALDEERNWLLTDDAGTAIGKLDNDPAIWLRALPRYAELQQGEAPFAGEHLDHRVPDQRLVALPGLYEELLRRSLPLEPAEIERLRAAAGRFESLCDDLRGMSPVETVQHGDLHVNAVFLKDDDLRILDWGDASIGHPFFSLVVTFAFLQEINGLAPDDPWLARLRDAYLEPWGAGLRPTFDLAARVGAVAHTFTWMRVRDTMDDARRAEFDELFPAVLRRASAALRES